MAYEGLRIPETSWLLQARIPNLADALNRGFDGYQEGVKLRDIMEGRARKKEYERTLKGLAQVNDMTTQEGQAQLIRDLSRLGFGLEAMGVQMPDVPKPVQQHWSAFDGGENGSILVEQGTGKTRPLTQDGKPVISGATMRARGDAARATANAKFQADKEEWDRRFKERQLGITAANITKDNELAATKAELARQKAEAEMARKAVDVGEVEASADQAVNLIDQMIGSEDGKIPKHPGFSTSVGAQGLSSLFGLMDTPVAGTDAAGFRALYDQVKGGAFMEAVQKMKGMGTLTETEGKAATAAISRMQLATSEPEFVKAAKEFRSAIKGRKSRILAKAGTPGVSPLHPQPSAPAADSSGWVDLGGGVRMRQKQ